jgi:hypothetical protein
MGNRVQRYQLAGVTYLVGAVLVLLITLSTPGLVSPSRYAAIAQVIFGVPFIVLFAWLMYGGDRVVARILRRRGSDETRARRWGERFQDGLTMVLSVSSLGRLFVFALNTLGYNVVARFIPPAVSIEPTAPQPLFALNSAIMLVILWTMIRASWLPFLQRHVHFGQDLSAKSARVNVKRDLS